jgi:hypothetical protein
MNEYTLTLAEEATNSTNILEEILLQDRTNLIVSINNVLEEYCPISIVIDWGDGDIDTEQSRLIKDYREDSILNEVLYGKFSSIFAKNYEHVYNPSTTSLFKTLTAEITVNYVNFDELVYILPLKIRTADFFESIEDIKLTNTKIITGGKEHQFITKKSGQVIEIRNIH